MKKLIVLASVMPSLASAAPFCVRNLSNIDLTWSVGKGKTFQSQPMQDPGQQWSCIEVPAGQSPVEVSSEAYRYGMSSCTLFATGNDWVEVVSENQSGISCSHLSNQGRINDVTMKMAGSESGWTLRGFVDVDGPLRGANISIYDKLGNRVGTGKSSENGVFEVSLKSPLISGFKVEAKGGKTSYLSEPRGIPFRGTLTAQVEDRFDLVDDRVRMNIVSTLADSFHQKNPGLSSDVVDNRVRKYLKLGTTTDLKFDVADPMFRPFSAKTFFNELNEGLGARNFDTFIDKMAEEMALGEDREHAFPAADQPKQLKFGGDIAFAMVKEIAAQGASKIFFGFIDGIYPSTETKILRQVQELSAQLRDVRQAIANLDIHVTQGNYDNRVQPLMLTYGEIFEVYNHMQERMKEAKDNEIRKDPVVAARIKADFARYKQSIIDKTGTFVNHMHTAMVPPAESKLMPIQAAYAEAVKAQEYPLIRPSFFAKVNQHIEAMKGYQAFVLALAVDARFATPGMESIAEEMKRDGVKYYEEEQRRLPEGLPFSKPELSQDIELGRAFYDTTNRYWWKTSFFGWASCVQIRETRERYSPGSGIWYPALRKHFGNLVAKTGVGEKKIGDMLKNWGFSDATLNQNPMFDVDQDVVAPPTNCIHKWYGIDQTTMDHMWSDGEPAYNRVRINKGLAPGTTTMVFTEVRE